MRIRLFYHAVRSDWNNGNAHFLRGLVTELMARGHDVLALEPRAGWSVQALVHDNGTDPLHEFQAAFPHLRVRLYDPGALDLDEA
ncbi:MAG: glycosyltransferase, partial [Vicinamibacteria bacterium]